MSDEKVWRVWAKWDSVNNEWWDLGSERIDRCDNEVVLLLAADYDALQARVAELEQEIRHVAVDQDALDQAHERIAELERELVMFEADFDALKADLTTYAMYASDPERARHEGACREENRNG